MELRLLHDYTDNPSDRNDLEESVEEALQDSEVFYTLAYYPSEQKLDGRFRRIKVKVSRRGVSLRYRRGYYDARDSWSGGAVEDREILQAVWSPVDANAVGLEAWIDAVSLFDPDTFLLRVRADTDGLTLEQRDDRWVGELRILLVQTDETGRDYDGMTRIVPVELPQQIYESVTKQGLVMSKMIRRNRAATALRVMIRDLPSGNLGRVIIPFSRRRD
jgi:hypothetical protein